MARIRKRFTVSTMLVLAAMLLLVLPDCARFKVEIINASRGELDGMSLSIRDQVVWLGRLKSSERRHIAIGAHVNGRFLLKGRYAGSDVRFEQTSAYTIDHDRQTHVFLVKDDRVHYGSWRAPPHNKSDDWSTFDTMLFYGTLLVNVIRCVDHDLRTWIQP